MTGIAIAIRIARNHFSMPAGELARRAGILDAARVKVERLERENERLTLIVSQICPHCGGRMDVQPTHIERCFCLPTIRGNLAHIADLTTQLAERDRALAGAPHGAVCKKRHCSHDFPSNDYVCEKCPCNCWKSRALAAIPAPSADPAELQAQPKGAKSIP